MAVHSMLDGESGSDRRTTLVALIFLNIRRDRCGTCRAAMTGRKFASFVRPALVNGTAGAVAFGADIPFAILAFTVVGDRALTIDIFNVANWYRGLCCSAG